MSLVYLPEPEALFLWGAEASPRELPGLGRSGASRGPARLRDPVIAFESEARTVDEAPSPNRITL